MGERDVLTPVGDMPRVFREVLYFRIPTGGLAQGLVFDRERCRLQAEFLPYDYDAITTSNEALRARLSQLDDGVLVELDGPRHVVGVHIARPKATRSGRVVEYYRMDGNDRAPTAFSTSNPPPQPQGGNDGEISMMAVGEGYGMAMYSLEMAGVAMGMEHHESPYPGAALPGYQVGIEHHPMEFFADFTESRFVVLLIGTGEPLVPEDIVGIDVRSYPNGPRIGLAFPDGSSPADLSAAVFFWRVPGQIDETAQKTDSIVDRGPDMAAELQRAADRLADSMGEQPPDAVIPDTLDVALVIESDAPCVFSADEFRVRYHMTRKAFAEGEDKQVLRFDADRVVSREFSVPVPGNADIVSASLDTVESLQAGRVVGCIDPLQPLSVRTGIRTDSKRWIATPIVVNQGRLIVGAGVAVMAIISSTKLKIEVQEDAQGLPSGRRLAECTLQLEPASKLAWSTLWFDEFMVMPDQPCWLLLTATDGEAIWLTRNGEGSVLALSRPGPDSLWQTEASFECTAVSYVLFEHADPTQGQAGVSLRVGNRVLNGSSYNPNAGTRTYDLTSALDAYLTAHQCPTLANVPLTLTSTVPGMITAYPPLITYDLRA